MTDWPHINLQIVDQDGLLSANVTVVGEYEAEDVLNSLLIAAAQIANHLELPDGEVVDRLARYDAGFVLIH